MKDIGIYFIMLFGIVIVIYLIRSFSQGSGGTQPVPAWAVQKLVRQIGRWAVAAEQDESPLIAVLHANYAAGYLWALKDIATPQQIAAAGANVEIDIGEIETRVLAIQDQTTRQATAGCPQYAAGMDPYLSRVAGDV